MAESPSPRHQDLLLEIAVLLRVFVGQHRLGTIWIAPLDVILDTRRALVVQPDLFFVSNRRQDIVTDRIWGAPDMVLEVMSPNPRIGDLQQRIDWFGEYGVRECWLVHQLTREIEVLQLDRHGRPGPPHLPRRGAHRIHGAAVLWHLAGSVDRLVTPHDT